MGKFCTIYEKLKKTEGPKAQAPNVKSGPEYIPLVVGKLYQINI